MIKDSRISYIDLFGHQYPMCLTVLAQEEITKAYGGVQKLLEKIEKEGLDALPCWVDLIHELMVGGKARVKALAFMSGEDVEVFPVPGTDQMKEIIGWADIMACRDEIYAAIGLSAAPTVEAEPIEDNEKNVETAQE